MGGPSLTAWLAVPGPGSNTRCKPFTARLPLPTAAPHHPEQDAWAHRGARSAKYQGHHAAGEVDGHRAESQGLAMPVRRSQGDTAYS